MPLSTDVNLPRDHEVRFPSGCIQCNNDPDGSTMRLRPHAASFLMISGSLFSVEIPACQHCTLQMGFRKSCLVLISIVVAFCVMLLVRPHLENFVPGSVRKWIGIGLVLTSLVPFILYSAFYPPAFDVTVYTDSVD